MQKAEGGRARRSAPHRSRLSSMEKLRRNSEQQDKKQGATNAEGKKRGAAGGPHRSRLSSME